MPDLDQTESSEISIGPDAPTFDFSEIGVHAPFNFSPEPHYLKDDVWVPEEFEDAEGDRDLSPLSEDARNALMNLDYILSKADVAPRRIEIEQAWKALHYDRGYQFLLKNKNGGWTIPASGAYSGQNQQNLGTWYSTNIFGEKGEIITAALAREVPRVEFFPANPDHAPDQEMADIAEDLKDIWAKNNNLQCVCRDIAKIFWNEDRAVLWTRYELNGDEYGYEDPDEPVVPEDETNPPLLGTGTQEDTQYQIGNESPTDAPPPRRPRGRVRTTAFGKLEAKVPIYVDSQFQMCGVQLFEDKDVSQAKAQFPWMQAKIRGGGDGTGETELDRIARENVRQAVPGQYVTGDSINRHTVVKYTYFRRQMFFDAEVKPEVREELLAKFPDGCLLVKAATEFCYARNENMDDHLSIGHPFPGKGQNRRSLGESLLPIQDYINELVCLALDFAKRTVAKKWMDNEAFNLEALKGQNNVPGSIGPFQRQPGVPVSELIFIEPTPTPQPWLVTWIQWIITNLSEQISGALPSLFGAQISGQVGSEGVAIQRDQALQRVGCPWNELQSMFALSARQAAMLTAKCANKDINDVIPGKGRVSIKLNQMKGAVLCYPESNPDLPESWAQREARIMSLVDHALASPSTEYSQELLSAKNFKMLKSVLRLPDLVIKGAASVEKQQGELEILLRSGPQPNPDKLRIQAAIEQAQTGMADVALRAQSGAPVDPAEIQQVQQAQPMIAQLQQQMATMPDLISTVPVREDTSEDHDAEAEVLFDWMNGVNGRKFSNGTPEQQQAFQNVYLHWQKHTETSAQIKAANAPPPIPPKVSFSANIKDLPAPEAAAAVMAGGIPASPDDFGVHRTQEMNRDIAKKVVPDTIYTSGLHKDTAEKPDQESNSNPTRKLRK